MQIVTIFSISGRKLLVVVGGGHGGWLGVGGCDFDTGRLHLTNRQHCFYLNHDVFSNLNHDYDLAITVTKYLNKSPKFTVKVKSTKKVPASI